MCLSTVFLNAGDTSTEVMKDVAHMEADKDGYWLFNLFGEKKFVEGAIQSVDLVDEHLIVLHPHQPA